MEIYTNIDQIDIEQWTDLLKKSDTASFFSSKECYNFYKSLSFFDEFVFAVSHNGKLQGVVVGYIQQCSFPKPAYLLFLAHSLRKEKSILDF